MTERTSLDSHRLMYHPERVAAWLNDEEIYPLYVEIGPSSRCNYRCSFCALDYTGYKGKLIPRKTLLASLEDMAQGGVKSVMFAGAGESLTHPDIAEFIQKARASGMDVALTTNGSLLTAELAKKILPHLSWIRFSVNAGTKENYAAIHGCSEESFQTVLDNIQNCVDIKIELELDVTIGTQCVILGENIQEVIALAQVLKKTGVDYFSLKPFSKHPLSHNKRLIDASPEVDLALYRQLEEMSSEQFTLTIRTKANEAVSEEKKPYGKCLGLPFFACLEASGDIYPCHSYMGLQEFSYGNIIDSSFKEVWCGAKRKKITEVLSGMIESKCRKACRLDQVNRYLWQLTKRPEHVNFI